jgi:hypothetical protein
LQILVAEVIRDDNINFVIIVAKSSSHVTQGASSAAKQQTWLNGKTFV